MRDTVLRLTLVMQVCQFDADLHVHPPLQVVVVALDPQSAQGCPQPVMRMLWITAHFKDIRSKGMIHFQGFEEAPSLRCLHHAEDPLYNVNHSGMVSVGGHLHSSPNWF